MILNIVCETSAVLWVFYFVNILRTLLFIIMPIVLIVVIIYRFFKNLVNVSEELPVELKNVAKKIGSVIIIFFIPFVVTSLVSSFSSTTIETYNECTSNATLEKIRYYESVEEKVDEVFELLDRLEGIPSNENLVKAESAVSNLYGIANGTIIEDFEYKLATMRASVEAYENRKNCIDNGGSFINNYCDYSIVNTNNNQTGSMSSSSFNSSDYYVINAKISVDNYMKIVNSKKIFQKQSNFVYSDRCLCFAEEYAHALLTGNTSRSAATVSKSWYKTISHDNNDKNVILKMIYQELTNNNPVILQVNGNKAGTSRHYVTVVGFKKSVKNANSLRDTDLLIIDSYDGKLEPVGTQSPLRFMTTGDDCKKEYSGYQIFLIA